MRIIIRLGLLVNLSIIFWSCARGSRFKTFAEAGHPTVSSFSVEQFLQKRFFEGVPLTDAGMLGAQAVPTLVRLLDTEQREDDHKHIVSALGFVGGPRARQSLVGYLENSSGEVSLSRFEALLDIPIALGRLASRGDDQALRYLLDRSEPSNWVSMKWRSADADGLENLYMARAVVNGLGISGRQEAFEKLLKLRSGDERLQECLEENIALNRLVANEGLKRVEEKLMERRLECPAKDASNSRLESLEEALVSKSLSILHHVELDVDPSLLAERLAEANGILQCKNSERDVACCLQINVAEPFAVFGEAGDGDVILQCESQLLRVLCLPGAQVKLVAAISGNGLCETQGDGSFSGCAEEPGENIVMQVAASGDVWAHEYGHNRGLRHRDDSIYAIMHPTQPGPDEVNFKECLDLRGGGTTTGNCPSLETCVEHP